jgi:hypothetical protein
MNRVVRDTPNWRRDLYSAVRQLDDGDTIIVPHDLATAVARQLARLHGKEGVFWFCSLSAPLRYTVSEAS